MSTAENGAKGEFLAMKEFVIRGWAVFVPIAAPTSVDFIAYNPMVLKAVRVQVKSGLPSVRGDGYLRTPVVRILKGIGHKGKQKSYDDDAFDLLAIVYNNSSVFLLNWPFNTKAVTCVCVTELMAYTADKWNGFTEDLHNPIASEANKYLVEDMF